LGWLLSLSRRALTESVLHRCGLLVRIDAFSAIAVGESVVNLPLATKSLYGCRFEVKAIRGSEEMAQYFFIFPCLGVLVAGTLGLHWV
jgi:hypothetical protein